MSLVEQVFESIADARAKTLPKDDFIRRLTEAGLNPADDPRFAEMMRRLTDAPTHMDLKSFSACVSSEILLVSEALSGDLTIPDWQQFSKDLAFIFDSCRSCRDGKVADYIPQLARMNPELWGVSVCSTSGQRQHYGDVSEPFSIQSVCKTLNYCLVQQEHGVDKVHQHVGREPSGKKFNELILMANGLAHNPYINAGAITAVSLIRPDLPLADRFDYIMKAYERLAGGQSIGFSNATYLSERATADRNFALCFYLKEKGAFPDWISDYSKLMEVAEFYFQLCSIEVTAKSLAVIGGTLANGGVCPITGERVVRAEVVENMLSLMFTCGMYDYSGEFAFSVGLPAKSGVSGAVLVVIPGVMGIATFSPRLDSVGNSVRGVQFCKELVSRYPFHLYENSRFTSGVKRDPRVARSGAVPTSRDKTVIAHMLFAASRGDLKSVRQAFLTGCDIETKDHDGRTALHLACMSNSLAVVRFLLARGASVTVRDTMGITPLAYCQDEDVRAELLAHGAKPEREAALLRARIATKPTLGLSMSGAAGVAGGSKGPSPAPSHEHGTGKKGSPTKR